MSLYFSEELLLHNPLLAYVDDDPNNLAAYSDFLGDEFEMHLFQTPDCLEKVLDVQKFDCFLIDIKLAKGDCFDLVEKIRQHERYRLTPIFFITGSPEDCDKIKILKIGIADVFDRFVHRDELVVRMRSKITAYKEYSSLIVIGSLVIDRAKLDCRLKSTKLVLTLLEFKILVKLASVYPQPESRDSLVNFVWGGDTVSSNSLNTHISNLRAKLKGWEYEIVYDKNSGFNFSKI